MTVSLPPAAFLVAGAPLVALARGRLRKALPFVLLALSMFQLLEQWAFAWGEHQLFTAFDYTFVLARYDHLSLPFAVIFHIALLLCLIFSFHVKDRVQQVTGLLYGGAAIGACLAGDLLTFFVYWELTAIASVFLVWAARTERSYRAGLRYLIVQVGSGVILMAGILFHVAAGGSLAFNHLGTGTLGTDLILVALGIKCAFPLLHAWLPDAYPEATPTGSVFLSVFTTKLAIYALARGFAGTEGLVWVGVTMTLFPIVFALLADDFRRLLSYSLIIQLGFMVAAIGIGTPLAVNGAVAHAIAHILYKSLLFMTVGAVIYRTGTARASRVGGLARTMPWTAACCVVGAASIAAVPLFCAFVSKSLITTAVGEGHPAAYVALLAASACSVLYVSFRVPWFLFFGEARGPGGEEAPRHMRIAMGAGAVLCVLPGVFPRGFYGILPHPDAVAPAYTLAHVSGQLELLLAAGLALALLMRRGLYARPAPGALRDVDWLYRRALPAAVRACMRAGGAGWDRARGMVGEAVRELLGGVRFLCAPQGVFGRTWPTSSTVLWVAILLAVLLVVYFV